MQQGNNKSFSGGMSTSYRGSRSNQGSNGNVSHHSGHSGNRRNDHRHSPDGNNNSNNSGRNEGRYSHGGGGRNEVNGRNTHGSHGGHGGGGYGSRASLLSREQARASPTQPNQHFVSRNHKEIVDFFQHNFEIIKDQTLNASVHKTIGGGSRKAVYYQPSPASSPTITPNKTSSY